MKTNVPFFRSLIVLIAVLYVFPTCKNKDDLCNPIPQFNIDLFVQEVNARTNDAANPVSGYQFAVNRNGQLYHAEAGGVAIHAKDPNGPKNMTVDVRMTVASVSKFIGAMAMMKVMEDYGIGGEFNVIDYLPDSWKTVAHPDFKDVDKAAFLTFKRLMTMNTAIAFPGTNPSPGIMPTEAQMLAAIRATPDPTRIGVYQNGNFTMIRVLIGEIVYGLDETSANYATACTDKYFEYIKTNFFDKLNVYPPMTAQAVNDYYSVTTYPLGYRFPFDATWSNPSDGTLGWAHTSDPYLNGGSGGLLLSCMDLAKLLAYFRHDDNETLISKTQREKILSEELGLIESADGAYGRYQAKGGTRGPESCCNRALRAQIVFFPNGVEAVLLSNCNIATLGSILRDSFDAAWEGC
ncbi:MAG: beta-lactamase family protein [Saprospiraceae bacterium]|nr:beta-lactamase family protein [Saprospiraceae bacterium]